MANTDCFPVYIETSLDTRLVLAVSSDDTVASLKRLIVAEHPVAFPVIGEIVVRAVKTDMKGVMFNLSDSMPVSTLHNHGNILCYVEAVTTNHERNLRNGRVDEELKVPIGGRIEDLMVDEVPHIDEEILDDPLHNLAEAPACVLKKTEKKKRRKNKPFEDTSMRLSEFRKREDEGFEGNCVKKERGHTTSKKKREVNVQASNPADSNLINFCGENQSANGGKIKKEESGKGEQICIEDGGLADKSDKRKRRKNAKVPEPAYDAIGAVGEFHNMKEAAHEAGLDKGRDLSVKNLGHDFASPQIPGEPKCNAQAEGDSVFHDQPVTNEISDQGNTNRGTAENGDPAKAPNQSGTNYGITESLEENARKDDTEKVQPTKEVTQTIDAVLGSVAREKKKRKKTKGFSSDVPSEALPIREHEPQVEDNTQISVEKVSKVPVKSGSTAEIPNPTPSLLFISREEPEGNSRADKHIGSKNQPQNDQNAVANDMEECRKEDANKNVSKDCAHVVGGDPGVVSREKKKRKKTKDAFTEVSTHEPSSRENESCKEKASNLVLEKETSEVRAASFGNSAAEAVKERSRKKRTNTKASSSDMPHELPPIGEDDSEKADDKMHKSNQIAEKQRDSEIPKKSAVGGAAEADNSVPCQPDSKEDSGKVIEVIKETDNVTGGDPGVFSLEKRRRKKKKAASIEGLGHEAMENESGQEKGNDLILEKEIIKEVVDTGLINIAGSDPGVGSVEKKRHKKTKAATTCGLGQKPITEEIGSCKESKGGNKAANTDVPPQELSAVENDSSKEGESNLMPEKEASKEADDARFTNNEIGSRETFVLERNQTLDSNMVEDSVGDSKKKKKRKQEATNSGTQATIDGAADEANGSIKNSVPQTDASGKKKPKTKIKKSLKEDSVPGDLTFVDKKSSKDKSKEKGVPDKHSDASLTDETTQNAPNTPEKVQKSGDNCWAENRNKEAFPEDVRAKGSEVLHAPTTEKINFRDYFLPKGSDQPADATRAPLKETKESKKIQNNLFSKDGTSASVDTRVSEKTKKLIDKLQTTEKPVKISKEQNPSENSNDKSRACTSMDHGVSKRDEDMKRLLSDMAVMSDVSTEDEEEVRSQPRKLMVAVRKVASKTIGEKMDASRKTSTVFSSGGHHDDMASDTSTRDESKSVKRGLPIPGEENGRAMMSPSSSWKDERVADDDVPMSQESTRPKKKVNLSSILRSSSSFKKAKISASQSQAEDSEFIDVVFMT